jgi:hypothetical protein
MKSRCARADSKPYVKNENDAVLGASVNKEPRRSRNSVRGCPQVPGSGWIFEWRSLHDDNGRTSNLEDGD